MDRSDALTPRQMDALHDAFNRVLAGEYDGEIPIEVYQRAYDKICVMGNRIAALTTPKEAPAATGAGEDLDLYDDKVQEGITWTMRQWGEALGLTTWTQGDGSESVEGDVHAEIHTILGDAGLRDPETNEMATLRGERVVEAVLEMAAKAVEDHQREGREWVPGSLWDDITRQAAGRIRAVKTQAFTILTKSGEAELLSDPQQLKRAEPVTDPYTLDGA